MKCVGYKKLSAVTARVLKDWRPRWLVPIGLYIGLYSAHLSVNKSSRHSVTCNGPGCFVADNRHSRKTAPTLSYLAGPLAAAYVSRLPL